MKSTEKALGAGAVEVEPVTARWGCQACDFTTDSTPAAIDHDQLNGHYTIPFDELEDD